MRGRIVRSVEAHTAKFIEHKELFIAPDALLRKEHRRLYAILNLDCDDDAEEERGQQNKPQKRENRINTGLEDYVNIVFLIFNLFAHMPSAGNQE